jgi:hypothetical protein
MKRFPVLALVLFTLTVVAFWATSVITSTLYPAMDSYGWQSVPNSNNGHSDNFEITSASVNPKNMRGWIAFNIGAIPSSAWIIHAQLRLRVWSKSTNDPSKGFGDSTGRIYGVYRITQPWQEYKVTWANQPNYTEEHHAIAAVPVGEGGWSGPLLYMDWDLTEIIRDWQSGTANYGVVVRDTQENSQILYSTQFFTHDKVPNETYYPRLIVTYVKWQSLVLLVGVFVVEGLFITAIWRIESRRGDDSGRK